MKILYEYGERKLYISPYNTHVEKDIMLMLSLEKYSIDTVLELLGNTDDLTYDEKIALLLKYRSVSVGEEIPIKYKCKCGYINESVLNIENIVTDGTNSPDIKDQYKLLTDENFSDFIDTEVEEMDLEEYDILYEKVKNSICSFDFKRTSICYKCKDLKEFDLRNDKFIIENMSEDNLMGIYQSINDLVYFGHYSKLDIDSMYPFERAILIGLLNKTREDINK